LTIDGICGATMLNGVGTSRTFRTINAQTKPIEGAIAAGRDMALLACTGCHVVEPNQPFKPLYPGPPFPPDFKDVANRPNVAATSLQHHLDTLAAIPDNSHMPNLLLSSDEVRDVVAFILSLRDKSAAPAQ
jgi:mono/diheme cytochrome c family protein